MHRKKWIYRLAAVMLIAWMLVGCQKAEREIKDKISENVGLERTVNILNFKGDIIRTYEGRIDLEDTVGSNKVKFDLDGKRYVYYNCSAEVIEK